MTLLSGQNSAIEVVEVNHNTDQKLISITEDKLRLILLEYRDKDENNKAWQIPLGLLVTIILVFCSAEFKPAFRLSAAIWEAIFMISGILCAVWLFRSLYRLRSAPTLDQVINSIKNKTLPSEAIDKSISE